MDNNALQSVGYCTCIPILREGGKARGRYMKIWTIGQVIMRFF